VIAGLRSRIARCRKLKLADGSFTRAVGVFHQKHGENQRKTGSTVVRRCTYETRRAPRYFTSRATSRPALLHKPRDEEPWPLRINRWPQRPIEIKRELRVCREPLKICLAETKMLVSHRRAVLRAIVSHHVDEK